MSVLMCEYLISEAIFSSSVGDLSMLSADVLSFF